MANIDVSELLSDPDFVDKLQLVSRTSQVNSLGETLITEEKINTVGSVQPASGKVIQRLPEALRVANLRSFWVRGAITVNGAGQYTSVIVFRGQRFQVQTVFDWTNWGAGWSEGTCVAEALS